MKQPSIGKQKWTLTIRSEKWDEKKGLLINKDVFECDTTLEASRIILTYQPKKGYESCDYLLLKQTYLV